jgi:endogenous inhibitor of DNA gyrase (YacG/DUF329 family)
MIDQVICKLCGRSVERQRVAQVYCSKQCRQNDFHQRKRSVERELTSTMLPEKRRTGLERALAALTVRP